jgi:hypothetical protein
LERVAPRSALFLEGSTIKVLMAGRSKFEHHIKWVPLDLFSAGEEELYVSKSQPVKILTPTTSILGSIYDIIHFLSGEFMHMHALLLQAGVL